MKTESEAVRFKETAKLSDYGFSDFEKEELFPAGSISKDQSTINVAKGKKDTADIALEEAIEVLIKKGTDESYSIENELDEEKFNENGELIAPIEKGEKIGTAKLVYDGEEDYGYLVNAKENTTVDLVTTSEVEKKNWFSLMLSSIGGFFTGLFDSIVGLFK